MLLESSSEKSYLALSPTGLPSKGRWEMTADHEEQIRRLLENLSELEPDLRKKVDPPRR